VDPSSVVELRVHGVSGTPPTELLDRALVRQVAGDGRAGFYRPVLSEQLRDDNPGPPPVRGPLLEGYSWGGLTSGAAARAFWLVLLPFTLANVAPRMRPPTGERHRANAALWWLSRVLALSLTAMITLTAAGVSMDLVAWQCGADPTRCPGLPSPLAWLTDPSPGVRLLLGGAMPLLVLLGLWALARQSAQRYERVDPRPGETFAATGPGDRPAPSPGPGAGTAGSAGDDVVLTHPDLWRGEHLGRRLRRLHVVAGVLPVVATMTLPAYLADRAGAPAWLPLGAPPRAWAGWVVLAACATTGAAVAVLVAAPPVVGRDPGGGTWGWVADRSWWALSLPLLAGAAAVVSQPREGWQPVGGLPYYDALATWLFTGQVAVVLALAAVVAWLRRGSPALDPAPPLGGHATTLLSTLALLLAAGFSAGLYVYSAVVLVYGTLRPGLGDVERVTAAEWSSAVLVVPQSLRAASLGLTGTVCWMAAVIVAALVAAAVRLAFPLQPRWWARSALFRWRLGEQWFHADYGVGPPLPRVARDRAVLRVFWLARRTDGAGALLGWLLWPVAAAALALTAVTAWSVTGGAAPTAGGGAGRSVLRRVLDWEPALVAVGMYGTVLLLLGLVALGGAAFRVPSTRRSVGILWDVGSFWPRAAHPFAAPCYAERTVPDLVCRVRWHLRRDGPDASPAGALVLAGHSQGSVITAAVLLQLPEEDLHRVAFLSYGCVLRRLYSRFFPAYLGTPALAEVGRRLRPGAPGAAPGAAAGPVRWTNLWRHSDYLGGAVASGPAGADRPGPARASTGATDGSADACRVPDEVDVRLVDPRYAPPAGDRADPRPGRHSSFPADPALARAAIGLARSVTAEVVPPEAQAPAERQGLARSDLT